MVADRLMGQARRLLPDFSGTGKRTAGGIGIAILVAVLLYYPVGMVITNSIDDDVDYKIADAALPEGGSRAVAMAASLITREVDENRWVANDPFFLPPSALDNMPNYQ